MSLAQKLRTLVRSVQSQARHTLPNDERRPSDVAYTLYWARQAISWERERREHVEAELEALVSEPEFRPNEYFRVYSVPGLDESAHSGASLVALKQVLEAVDRSELEGDFDD